MTDQTTVPIRKMLDLSNGHLPPEIGVDGLSSLDGVIATELPHGWLMWVPNDPEESNEIMEYDIPEVVLNIQKFAREHDCDYVLFDVDGPTVPGLPTWEW